MGSFSGLISSPSYSSAVRGTPMPSLQGQGLLLGTHEDRFLDSACCCCLATDICPAQALLTQNGAGVGWGGVALQDNNPHCHARPNQSRYLDGWTGTCESSWGSPSPREGPAAASSSAWFSLKKKPTYFPQQGKGQSICQPVFISPSAVISLRSWLRASPLFLKIK